MYVKLLKFDPETQNLSKCLFLTRQRDTCVLGVLVDQHTELEEVFIFFDTATYDQIERDV